MNLAVEHHRVAWRNRGALLTELRRQNARVEREAREYEREGRL